MLNAFLWLLDHRNVEFSFVKSLSGGPVSDKLWQNLLTYWHMPRKRCTPALSVGIGIFVIASTLAGSGSILLSVSLCPTKAKKRRFKVNFFRRQSCLLHFFNRLVRVLS